MHNSNIKIEKESNVEKPTPGTFLWMRGKISSVKNYQYELAFDTSKPFHYRVGTFKMKKLSII